MRNKIKILTATWVLAAMAMLLNGCSKFLDRKPLSATQNDLGSGSFDAKALGLYSALRGDPGFSTLPWLDFHSIRDDDAQKGSSVSDGAEINAEFETFQYTKNDWATNTYWGDHFNMIQLANEIIHDADSLKPTDQGSLRNIGEACFFRAYAYFDLVRAYGETYLPLENFYYTSPNQQIVPNAKAGQIYALIDSDLNVASTYLPLTWATATGNSSLGRLTSGAANTLWAQTYLFRGTWAKVVGLCKKVITSDQYHLTPNFVDIWKDGLNGVGKVGPESIWELVNYVGPNQSPWIGTQWGTSQNIRQGGASTDWNLGWGWNTPTQNLVNAWDSTDPRRNMTILFSGQYDGGPSTGGYGNTLPAYNPGVVLDQPYWNKKVYSDPQMRQFTGQIGSGGGADWIDHRILRYADVILMYAEASNETGDGATAETMLEMIRARARGSADPTKVLPHIAYVSQAQMRTAIKNERRWEFAMEGYRFYDLVRWGDAQTVLGSLGYQPRNALYPIPQPVIDQFLGKLAQNPNY
ncbi:MAG: RagB/SusD family nutrient uptake outer membrane protein [Bacteroidota bacterium]|nr:RagB/SusD family nutrient uptake outer membrane protein [Bacteroidota bacterium]MDP4217512.1 RagB/SusD family nutrient uptake outer membrane protein [Bacteroidota bacterium]MDP4246993.1 RagB/SusD family nutrient uptake outer membrane protein [Bacteroidota bacterium]MDP4260577.1 RagB/SusD family nutrient uptake outer membrane protein [Bacteroidota bacterium]